MKNAICERCVLTLPTQAYEQSLTYFDLSLCISSKGSVEEQGPTGGTL